MLESKQHAESYAKALAQLAQVSEGIENTLNCAVAMKESQLVDTPLLDETTRTELLNCINDCGNGISELTLTLDSVKLLKSKGDAFATQIKMIWKDAASKYSDGTKGYLSMLGSLSDNPKKAKDLADNIKKIVAGDPSIKSISDLVTDVMLSKEIIESFALNTSIETFLHKVSAQQATVMDLTPEILTWLKDKNLLFKLKIRF